MNKLFIRLLVAFIAFSLSMVLTGFKKFLTLDPPAPVIPVAATQLRSFAADESQICQIYAEYGPAQMRQDREFFERVETEDFILFVGHEQITRDEDIQWMLQQPPNITYEVRLQRLEVYGSSAVAHGVMEQRYSNGQVDEYPFIDIWVKRDNAWRIQSTHQRSE